MTTETMKTLLTVMENQVRQTKAAYYRAMPGVTYDDMAESARRLLAMRASYEKATGRRVTSRTTKAAVANLLRAL